LKWKRLSPDESGLESLFLYRKEVEQDTGAFDIVKAVQYGAFDRVQVRFETVIEH
jgi:hypothetical protein